MREEWPLQRKSCSGGSPWGSRPYPSRSERGSDLARLVRLAGFEPATRCLEGSRSVQLSYRRQPSILPVEGHATDTESAQPGRERGLSWPTHSGHQAAGRTLSLYRPRTVPATRPGAEVNVITMLGGVLSALTGHATWQAFVLLPDGKPTGLMALAAVTLTCLLVALLAQGAQLAAAVTAAPQRSGVAALREKSWRAGFISQRDPELSQLRAILRQQK